MPDIYSSPVITPNTGVRHKAKIVAIVLMGCAAFGAVLWVSLSDNVRNWYSSEEKTIVSPQGEDDMTRMEEDLDRISRDLEASGRSRSNSVPPEDQEKKLDEISKGGSDNTVSPLEKTPEEQEEELDALSRRK